MLPLMLATAGLYSLASAHLTQAPHVTLRHIDTEEAIRQYHKRQGRVQCDQSEFFCPTGTCFTNPADGYIGCCSVSSCAPRTSCIPYNPTVTSPCDINTGGCIYCSRTDAPACVVITNILADQYIKYCGTVATTETIQYVNVITTGSQWSLASAVAQPTSSSTPASTSASATAVPVASATAQAASSSASSPSGGAIGGIVAGSVIAVATILIAAWFFWKRSRKQYVPAPVVEKDNSGNAPSTPSGSPQDPAEAEGSTPKAGAAFYSPEGVAQYHEADSRPVSMQPHPAVRLPAEGLGISNRYKISNPDSPGVTSPAEKRSSFMVSPLLSQEGSESEVSAPRTPGNGRYYDTDTVYSPSVYKTQPPGSVNPAGGNRPPSLPQPYSTASMATELPANAGTMDARAAGERSPWAYLSPEAAVNGGWRNNPDQGKSQG